MAGVVYLKHYLAVTTAALLIVLAFNVLVDPFGMNYWLTVTGVNADKPEFGTHVRIGKAFAALRIEPSAIVLGSSRAEVGLDVGHRALGPKTASRYNLALPAASMEELFAMLAHARAAGPLREVVVGLDFFMFNANKPAVPGQDEPILIRHDGIGEMLGVLAFAARTALSYATVKASLNTIRSQGRDVLEYDDTGNRRDAYQETVIRRAGSLRAASVASESSLVRETYFAPPDRSFVFESTRGGSTLDRFAALLEEARHGGVALTLLISPEHARQLEVIRTAGLWSKYEDWKRRLVDAIAAEARRSRSAPFPLWDFSGYNVYTTEPLPHPSDSSGHMRWYWETSHYRRELGDRMLGIATSTGEGVAEGGFGVRLTLENVEDHLRNIRLAQVKYHRSAWGEVSQVQEAVCGLVVDCVRAASPIADRGFARTGAPR